MERNYNIEKLKYQENKFAYTLALIAFLINQVYLVEALDAMAKDYNMGIEIFVNLTMYLFLFLGMERVKNHHKNWSIFFMVLGAGFFLRILYIPFKIIRLADDLVLLGDDNSLAVAHNLYRAANISIVALIVAGLLIILSGMHGYKQSITIKRYYDSIELN